MPYKHNESRRHKFKKMIYKVTNWAEYTESLRRRGDITIWFSDDAIDEWHSDPIPGKCGRPQEYSDLAIECCLMLRQVYHLPLRQTEGFTRSLIKFMELDIRAPDYTSLSKRSISLELKKLIDTIEPGSHFILDSTGLKVYGRDEWHQEKHNVKGKRTWKRLHLGIDENHNIIACELTETSVGDPSVLPEMLDQVERFETFMGDGAYARFMDDWLILTKTRGQLRKIIKKMHRVVKNLKFKLAIDKTYIGRIKNGFDFLGSRFSKNGVIGLAQKTIYNYYNKKSTLYEQHRNDHDISYYKRRWKSWALGGLKGDAKVVVADLF